MRCACGNPKPLRARRCVVCRMGIQHLRLGTRKASAGQKAWIRRMQERRGR